MSKAIVTALIGEAHRGLWERHAQGSWARYAARWGYEIVIVQRPIDESELATKRNLHWQKLLILSLPEVQRFERVVWMDSDIIINDAVAPSIVEQVPAEKIGAVQDACLLAHPALASVYTKFPDQHDGALETARRRYRVNGLSPEFDLYLNSGVMVLSPAHHREVLESVYRGYREGPDSFIEQIPLSHEILKRGLHYPMDPRFNSLWLESKFAFYQFLRAFPALASVCMAQALANCYFLHFAGSAVEMALFDPQVVVGFDSVTFPAGLLDKLQENIDRHRGRAGK